MKKVEMGTSAVEWQRLFDSPPQLHAQVEAFSYWEQVTRALERMAQIQSESISRLSKAYEMAISDITRTVQQLTEHIEARQAAEARALVFERELHRLQRQMRLANVDAAE